MQSRTMEGMAVLTTNPQLVDVRPTRSLVLLSVAHAVNHAHGIVLPLIFLQIIDQFGVGIDAIAFLAAIGNLAAGLVQLSYAQLTRLVPRRLLLGGGGLLLGGGFIAQALATSFATFAVPNVASRIGGSPQHPVGNGLLAEQFPPQRRGFAIAAHIAGGNVGTVFIALAGVPLLAALGWRGTSVLLGLAAALVAIAILGLIRERGTDRAAAIASGDVRQALRRVVGDRDLRWLYLTSVLGGGGRGLGVVNLFALIYLSEVLALPESVYGPMYAVLVVFSLPMPLVAGWLSDRLGRKPLIIGAYIGGAVGFVVFILAGTNVAGLWLGIVLMGLFTFAESPQLQALLSDIAPPSIRDASYALYFTLAFGVGSAWVAMYGFVIERIGAPSGVPIAFALMAGAYVLAALGTLPIRADERAAANAAFEAGLPEA